MDAETWSDRFVSACFMTIVLLSFTRSLIFCLVKGPNAFETLLHGEQRTGMKTVLEDRWGRFLRGNACLIRQEYAEQEFILLFQCRSALLEAIWRGGDVYGTLPVREPLLSTHSVDWH